MTRFICRLCGWSGFWQDGQGRWYGYPPEETQGYWRHEAERHPLPVGRHLVREVVYRICRD